MKKYSGLFANGLKRKKLLSEVTVKELLEYWKLIQDQTLDIVDHLEDQDLHGETFKMPKPHPFVKTKENSISWNIKHTMWHCGQAGILKRVIDKPFDFGI